jgi:hypothetical protein
VVEAAEAAMDVYSDIPVERGYPYEEKEDGFGLGT